MVATFFFVTVVVSVALGQSSNANIGDAKDKYATDVIAELRLTRQVIQQLKKELVQLQVAAIQIRIQQDTVSNTEVRLDSIRSEARITDETLAQLRDRISKLESNESSRQDEDDQQSTRAELQDAKKEVERQQQKLELLQSQDMQLTGQLQIEKARLNDLLSRLDTMTLGTGTSNLNAQQNGPTGSPNN